MMRRAPTLVAFAALVLAGCSEPGAPQVIQPEEQVPTVEQGQLLFAGEQAVDEVAWYNGTFLWPEHHFPAGMLSQGITGTNPADHLHDVSGSVPTDVAVRIHLVATWDTGETGTLQLRMHPPVGATVYEWTEQSEPSGAALETIVMHGGGDPLLVGIRYNQPGTREAVDYSLAVRVTYDPEVIPAGVPVALEATGGQLLRFEHLDDGNEGEFLLWDGKDRLVFRGPFQSYNLTDATEYVFLTTREARAVMEPASTESQMRALHEETVQGDVVPAELRGETSWTFTLDRMPMRVTVALLESVVVRDLSLNVSGPAGVVLEADQQGTLLLSDWWWDSDKGHPLLQPGTYEVSWRNEAAVEARLAERATYYRR